MKGFIKIEATENGTSAHTDLRECSVVDQIEIISLVFRSLELTDPQEIAMVAAICGAANAANMFSGTEVKLAVPTKQKQEPEDEG